MAKKKIVFPRKNIAFTGLFVLLILGGIFALSRLINKSCFPSADLTSLPLKISWQRLVPATDCQLSFDKNELMLLNCLTEEGRAYYRFSAKGELVEKFLFSSSPHSTLSYDNGYFILRDKLDDSRTLVRVYKSKPVIFLFEKTIESSEIQASVSLKEKLALATNTQVFLFDLKDGALIKKLDLLSYDFYKPQLVDWLADNLIVKNENTILLFNLADKKVKIIKSAYNQGPINNYLKLADGLLLLTNNQQVLEKFNRDGQLERQIVLPFNVTNFDNCGQKIYIWARKPQTKGETLIVFDLGLNELKRFKMGEYSWRLAPCSLESVVLAQGRKIMATELNSGRTLWQCQTKEPYGLMGYGSDYLYLISLNDLSNHKTKIVALDPLKGRFVQSYEGPFVLDYPIVWQNQPAGYSQEEIEGQTLLRYYSATE